MLSALCQIFGAVFGSFDELRHTDYTFRGGTPNRFWFSPATTHTQSADMKVLVSFSFLISLHLVSSSMGGGRISYFLPNWVKQRIFNFHWSFVGSRWQIQINHFLMIFDRPFLRFFFFSSYFLFLQTQFSSEGEQQKQNKIKIRYRTKHIKKIKRRRPKNKSAAKA